MTASVQVTRREFLCAGAAVGALTLAVCVGARERAESDSPFQPNAFLRIGRDDSIVIIVGRSEMGQGVYTSLSMLIAEELDADWSRIRVESAPVATAYDNPAFRMQGTGGSCSVSSSWDPLRRAGAAARAMLVTAASEHWGVEQAACTTHDGRVFHEPSQRSLTYGQLAESAARLQPPAQVRLKDPSNFTIIGRSVKRLDLPEKSNGRAVYGIDIGIANSLVAVIARPPRFGERLRELDSRRALAIDGVRHVVRIDAGVAVVADDLWSAMKGRDALTGQWESGPLAGFDDDRQRRQYTQLLDATGVIVGATGNAGRAFAEAAQQLEVRYEFPYLAHTPMEPLNCVADVRADRCDVWVGTQFQTHDRKAAADAAGLRPDQVQLHTALLGGGFGRRGITDGHFVREAVQVSRAIGRPARTVWTRTDDIQGGYYRPAYQHRLWASLDADGTLTSWTHRVVGQSVLAGTEFLRSDGIDSSSFHIPFYKIPNHRVELHTVTLPIPVWAWRSVGCTHNAFAVECFIDELAHAAGKDPIEFRRLQLDPQRRAVLDLVAEKSGWGSALPPGRARGIAIHQLDSVVAQVAEVSVDADGTIRVHRVVCAIDCGMMVNPDTVRAQMEGGIAMGLSAALYEQINFRDGRVVQTSFADYPILRIDSMPRIEVHFITSSDKPRGVGEAGVPPIAPAVANAVFAATGWRLRKLPLDLANKLSG